jgi:clan AA aspartic protease
MITGAVSPKLQALLELMVVGPTSNQRLVDAVIDTGFSGHLTLPPSIISALNLIWLGREQGVLADGTVDAFEVYRAIVIWEGKPRFIDVAEVDAPSLIGMSSLERHVLNIEVYSGGAVSILRCP